MGRPSCPDPGNWGCGAFVCCRRELGHFFAFPPSLCGSFFAYFPLPDHGYLFESDVILHLCPFPLNCRGPRPIPDNLPQLVLFFLVPLFVQRVPVFRLFLFFPIGLPVKCSSSGGFREGVSCVLPLLSPSSFPPWALLFHRFWLELHLLHRCFFDAVVGRGVVGVRIFSVGFISFCPSIFFFSNLAFSLFFFARFALDTPFPLVVTFCSSLDRFD